ncbi:glutamate--tRNA ligase, cytoplasmic [Tanacetum coccineum]
MFVAGMTLIQKVNDDVKDTDGHGMYSRYPCINGCLFQFSIWIRDVWDQAYILEAALFSQDFMDVIRAGPHTVSAGCFVRSCWLHMITTGRCLMVLTGRLTVIAACTLQFVLIGYNFAGCLHDGGSKIQILADKKCATIGWWWIKPVSAAVDTGTSTREGNQIRNPSGIRYRLFKRYDFNQVFTGLANWSQSCRDHEIKIYRSQLTTLDGRTSMRELADSALAGKCRDGQLFYVSKSWLSQWYKDDTGPTAASNRCPHGALLPEHVVGFDSNETLVWLCVASSELCLKSLANLLEYHLSLFCFQKYCVEESYFTSWNAQRPDSTVEEEEKIRWLIHEGDGTKDTTFTKETWIEQDDAKAIVNAKAISPNLEITLIDFGNASIKEIKKASDGNVTELNGVPPPEESVYKDTKLKPLTWLPKIYELGPLTLVEFGYLLKKKKLGKNDDLIDAVNPDSRKEISAVRDANMRMLKRGEKRLFQM